MKSLLATALMVLAASVAAQAQTPAKPKAAASPSERPALQTPADTANAMAQTERASIQSDLAWIGIYEEAQIGEASDRMVAAIKQFQKNRSAKVTGVLNPQERSDLADAARKRRDNAGWKMVVEPVTGTSIGIPLKLVPKTTSDANGTKWTSPTGTVQISLERRLDPHLTSASVAADEKKAFARKLDYSAVKPDFFMLQGLQGLKKFYVRGQTRDGEARILTILYDQATEGTMTQIAVAMLAAFEGSPAMAGAQAAIARKIVEYSTGIVVDTDGAILADRPAVDGCRNIVVGGLGNAVRVADDATTDLALLRLYGAKDLKPLGFGGGSTTKPSVTITGIADPQSQGGRAAVSSVSGSISDQSLTPAMPAGFSGAPVIDSDGKFAGLARSRTVVVAGPPAASGASSLVAADTVRNFLLNNKVTPAMSGANATAAVVRVICVRK